MTLAPHPQFFSLIRLCAGSNKSTQKAQNSDKAAHYLYIAQIRDTESQHGDPDHP